MMGPLIYALCALTSAVCCALLWRAYGRSRVRVLFWSAACFGFHTLNNVTLVLDKVVFPTEVDLRMLRLVFALVAACLLLYGLISEEE